METPWLAKRETPFGRFAPFFAHVINHLDEEVWESLHSNISRPFPVPSSKRIAVKVINHLGDEVMKVFKV